MPKKLNSSPPVLVERAVLAAVANARTVGWRQAQMKVFANRFGDYPIPEQSVDLERECARIVRSAGYRYARKLLNWFISVMQDAEIQTIPLKLPIGIPSQSQFEDKPGEPAPVFESGFAGRVQSSRFTQPSFALD